MKTKIFYLFAIWLTVLITAVGCDNGGKEVDAKLSIESIAPEIGGPGTELLINGSGFPTDKSKITVSVNEIPLAVLNCNQEQILALVPENRAIGKAPVVVAVGSKSVRSVKEFTYIDARMYIESISPVTGGPGTELTINGGNFPTNGSATVTINDVSLPVKSSSETKIVVTIPNDPNIGTGTVVVSVGDQSVPSVDKFTFIEAVISISSISPTSGGFGTEVTINGQNFPTRSELISVTVNEVAFSVISATETKIVVAVPQSNAIGTGKVLLKVGAQTVSSSEDFTYVASDISVTSFSPASGPFDTVVTIDGENLPETVAETVVKINGIELEVQSASKTQIVVKIPKNKAIGKGAVVISKAGNSAASADDFTYMMTRRVITLAGTGEAGYNEGAGDLAQFKFIENDGDAKRIGGIVVDDNLNVYLSDMANFRVRKITPEGVVSTLAGRGWENPDWGANWREENEGKGSYSLFIRPNDLAIGNSGKVYVTDDHAGPSAMLESDGRAHYMGWSGGSSVAVDDVNNRFYFSKKDNVIKCKDLDDYGVSPKNTDGTEIIKDKFFRGLAVDGQGNLYVSVPNENRIYKYIKDQWNNPIVVAGNGNAGYKDGAAADAEFSSPGNICFDTNGNLFVAGNGADMGGANVDQSIRYIDLKTNTVTTFAGAETTGGSNEPFLTGSYGGVNYQTSAVKPAAAFTAPSAVAVDKNGDVYVLDRGNNTVKKIITE